MYFTLLCFLKFQIFNYELLILYLKKDVVDKGVEKAFKLAKQST